MADEHKTTVWIGIATAFVAIAVGLTAIEGVIVAVHPGSAFDWTAGIMIAAYAVGLVAAVLFVGLLRRWKWLMGTPSFGSGGNGDNFGGATAQTVSNLHDIHGDVMPHR
jgi:hypothetical protein